MEPWAEPDILGAVRPVADRALRLADAYGRVPTPLDDVQAALSAPPAQDLFNGSGLPPVFQEIARRLRGTILGALDMREHVVYIDRFQAEPRQRFIQGHEIGHLALPWHRGAYYGDDSYALDEQTCDGLEDEANGFGADVIFQGDRFTVEAGDYRLGIHAPLGLADRWGASRHAAVRRYVELNRHRCGLLVIGRYVVHDAGGGEAVRILGTVESPAFRRRYGPLAQSVSPTLSAVRSSLARDALQMLRDEIADPVVAGSERIEVGSGPHDFSYELTWNRWVVLAILFDRPAIQPLRRVRTVWTPAK